MGSSDIQGQLWGVAAANWAELQEPMSRPLWAAMLDAAGTGQGTRFFDAGCGGGGACEMAARRGAHVSGLDAAAALIAIARQRVPDGAFHVGDLEAVPLEDDAVEVSFAATSLMYAADIKAALHELARITESGGRVVVGIWGTPEQNEQAAVFAAVRKVLPSPPKGQGPFALSTPGIVEEMLERSGLKPTSAGDVDCPFTYENLEHFWHAQSAAGPMQAAIRQVGEETLKSAMHQAVTPYLRPDGSLRLQNRLRYVLARVE